jgi:[acyl-carrier-protein] S-malonyltransferase
MQKAASADDGGMTAVMNLPLEKIEYICAETKVTLANDNSPTQQVLSGSKDDLARAATMARSLGGRSVLLPVDGAYHSPKMEPAAAEVEEALGQTQVRMPRIPVVSNVSATAYRAPGEIRRLLTRQLTDRVRFRESIASLVTQETEFIDLGPGHVVGRLAKATIASERSAA